ncbi:MAG TPA: iron-containing alcohol dehydrogenase [Kofleriaceae bacterium]|nr:iron-containing alcohol dehydrogenase [Kofleriaceae bacterium]
MERVVVTGAQGFVGRHLVHRLLAVPGVELLGLGRSPDDRTAFTHQLHRGHAQVRAPLTTEMRARLASERERYRYRRIDLRHTAELVRVLGEFAPTCIVHLAAALRDQPLPELLDSNVLAAASLLDAVAGARIESCRVVLGSTGGVYGAVRPEALPLREELRGAPVDLYSLTKLTGEDATRILAERHGLRVVWARLFNLVGPGQEERHFFGRVATQLVAIRAGLLPPALELGNLAATRDFLDVRDAADALWLLARHGEPGLPYNVASGCETRLTDALALLLEVAGPGSPVEVRSIGQRAGDVARHWGDISRIRALGFVPRVPLRDSARDVVTYCATELAAAGQPVAPAVDAPFAVSATLRREYAVEVSSGLVARLHTRLAADYPGRKLALITDARVWELHGRAVVERAAAAGRTIAALVVPEGETSKSPERWLALIDALHRHRVDRRGLIVNLGGGLVIDLGGFVAAAYLRGIDYVNVPTTLVAQHDAAIGGKVAVNAAWGTKNFLGAFHHPLAVLCDPSVLRTLPPRDLAAGVAEAIKVALCGEPDLFRLLETCADRVRAGDAETLTRLVRLAAARKTALLAPDPYEVDLRRVLNLGHTLGHALEVEPGAELRHGEAVAFGIAVATALGVARGLCARTDGERIFALLAGYGLPPRISRDHADRALRRLDDIRLVRGDRLHFVIPIGIHGVHIEPEVSDAELAGAVGDVLARFGTAEVV